jgi:Ca-activated chloride channel family protein
VTRKWAEFLLGCILSSTVVFPARSQQPPPPAAEGSRQNPAYDYGVEVELVSLFATVQNSTGKLVTHLKQQDFVLYDNGVPQIISQFSREYIPLSVLILLDTSGSMYGVKLENARKSLTQFLRKLNRGDEAMLVTFQTRPRLMQGFTQDLNLVRRNLKRLEGAGSTALYDSILYALEQSGRSYNRRRALLLISDGMNTYGKTALDDTVLHLRRRGVELFAIGVETNLPEESQHRAVTRAVLHRLTESAGGEAFIISHTRELGKVCDMISDRMHNQYTFAYYPPKTADGQWRTIRIETRSDDYRVVPSKTGYYPRTIRRDPERNDP